MGWHCTPIKHEFNGTQAHLAFNQPAAFTVACAMIFSLWQSFPSVRDCSVTILLQKEHWAIKTVEMCVSTLSFSIFSIDYLVSWHDKLAFVVVSPIKSISLMLWRGCSLKNLKMFLLISFDLGCLLYVNTWTCLCYLIFIFSTEELKLCRQNIECLVKQRDDLENEIKRQKAAENRWAQKSNKHWLVYETFPFCPSPVNLCLSSSAVWQCFVCDPSISICVKGCRVRRSWRATSTLIWSNKSESEWKTVWHSTQSCSDSH